MCGGAVTGTTSGFGLYTLGRLILRRLTPFRTHRPQRNNIPGTNSGHAPLPLNSYTHILHIPFTPTELVVTAQWLPSSCFAANEGMGTDFSPSRLHRRELAWASRGDIDGLLLVLSNHTVRYIARSVFGGLILPAATTSAAASASGGITQQLLQRQTHQLHQ